MIGRVLLLACALICAVLAGFPFWVGATSRKQRRAGQDLTSSYFAEMVFWGVFFTGLAVYLALGAFGIWLPLG